MPTNLTDKMKNFIESNVSNDFGLSVEQVANKCKNYGRFKHWLNSDVTRIKEVLNKVKSNGVSPAFFASYEVTEGYNSSWGWLNHTRPNGTPLQDSDSVSKWIVSQSNNMTDSPAWIDYANYKDFVPQSVKNSGNSHFASLPKGTIGRVIIAGTAAATWEVYYPNGLKKEYNGVQDYGAPINKIIDLIISWGGNIEGGGTSFTGNIIDYLLSTNTGLSITSDYGMRWHPVDGVYKMHSGTDIGKSGSPSPETPVPSRAKIILAENSSGGQGNWVVFQLIGSDYQIAIFHFETIHVSTGDIVDAGTSLGVMGASGKVTGRHWHVEVRSLDGNSFFDSTHHDPTTINFNISGGNDGDTGNNSDNLITLFLCNALRNWG